MKKPIASLSLDLDNKWSYMKTHGDEKWKSFPSYLNLLVPRALEFLKERNLTITFFIVGQDAALEENRDTLATIAGAGHEVGNHSFHHEPWLHLYSEQQIAIELARAEEHIERATGQKPVGFRGPGFSLSRATLEVLITRGYMYDASTFPTFLGPLARMYYFMSAKLSPEQRRERADLFGSLSEGLRPIRPYLWKVDNRTLVEIPVTTMPWLRMPIHVSYLIYLGILSSTLPSIYLKTALTLCRLTGTQPSLLLHPLDFLGCDEERDLSFFPGMGLPLKRKLQVVSDSLEIFCSRFVPVTLQQHAREINLNANLRIVSPKFDDSKRKHVPDLQMIE